jgi:hypothetical protein
VTTDETIVLRGKEINNAIKDKEVLLGLRGRTKLTI